MPAPGRGTAVLHVGEIIDEADGYTVPVSVLGDVFDLPWVDTYSGGSPYVASGNNTVWVLFVGRTGLILGRVGAWFT